MDSEMNIYNGSQGPTPTSSLTFDRYIEVCQNKSYLHFDRPTDKVKFYDYLKDPTNIEIHSFYPLIHYTKTFNRFRTNEYNGIKEIQPKPREIYYASHKDQLIYKYYSVILDDAYNIRASRERIDRVSTAYRSNKKGQSNAHFAQEVFEFILKEKSAYVLTLDFKEFFDSIGHKDLKSEIEKTLNFERLPNDWYTIFKSITSYSYVNKNIIHKYVSELKSLPVSNRKLVHSYFANPKEFREFKKGRINKQKKTYGIPQGTALSATCANVRMIPVDKELQEFVSSLGGLYRRYSDDIVIVLPETSKKQSELYFEKIQGIIKKYEDLSIHPRKINELLWENQKFIGFDKDGQNNQKSLQYLGFSFNGYELKLRDSSISNYYTRAYKKIRKVNKLSKRYKRNAYHKSLYNVYTHLGTNYRGYGNFISYSINSQKVMRSLEKYGVKIKINQPAKRHWKKIQRKIKKYN